MVMRKGEGWSALFTTSMRGLDGEYELRFPHGERVPIRLRDLREAASDDVVTDSLMRASIR